MSYIHFITIHTNIKNTDMYTVIKPEMWILIRCHASNDSAHVDVCDHDADNGITSARCSGIV